MIRFILIALTQSAMLAMGQVFLKMGLDRLPAFEWTTSFFKHLALDWPLAACGVGFGGASLLWIYMLRNFDFSQAYPITAMSYIFGMFAAYLIFDESIPWTRWIGVVLIIVGVYFISKQ